MQQTASSIIPTTDIPESEEISIGRDVSATLLGAAPTTQQPNLQSYVNKVGMWLVAQTERPQLPWRFAVLEDPTINAFAAPGGYVFVTRGLLNQLSSEAELAGVLSHEIAHVLQYHHLKAIKAENIIDKTAKLTGTVLDLYLGSQGKSSLSAQDKQIAQHFVNGTKKLYAHGLAREDELEADRMALVISARAGYDPYAYLSVLQKLQALSAGNQQMLLLLRTHPQPADRLAYLEKLLPLNADTSKNLTLEQRFGKQVK